MHSLQNACTHGSCAGLLRVDRQSGHLSVIVSCSMFECIVKATDCGSSSVNALGFGRGGEAFDEGE